MHVIDGTKLGAKSKEKMAAGVKPLLKILQPILDNRFALIHTLTVAGRRERIDALLVGPHGASVLKVESLSGRYRFLGDNVYAWDKKAKGFVGVEYNPVLELKQGQRLIETTLSANGLGTIVPVDSAVVFVDPKLQLEHMEPPVRLIEPNAIKEWAAQLASTHNYIEQRDIEKTLAVFGAHASIASTLRAPAAEEPGAAAPAAPRRRRARRGPLGLTRMQLAAVIGMVVVYLIVMALVVSLLLP